MAAGKLSKSKAHVRFLNRVALFDADVELVDVFTQANSAGSLSTNPKSLFDHVNKTRHPRLAAYKISDASRRGAVTHLRNTVHAAYIKDVYEEMAAYFAEMMRAAASNGLDPSRLVGEHKFEVAANDILRCGSWEAIVKMVATSLFRRLESERSTAALLQKLGSKLNLKVDPKVVTDALPYLEIRHLLVHQDGLVDEDFRRAHPKFLVDQSGYLDLSRDLVAESRRAIVALVEHYDREIISNKLLGADDIQ